jgi:hypothetical protein
MKKLFFLPLLALIVLASCKDKKADDKTSESNKATGSGDKITYPYTPEYSSDMSLGDPNHSKLVLDLLKAWDDNKLDDMRSYFADTVHTSFVDGSKFDGPADSLVAGGKALRASFSSVQTKVDAWMPVHVNDKNEDYVLVWSRDYSTKDGMVDSTASHTYWEIKNNKIAGWHEFQAKLAAPKENH